MAVSLGRRREAVPEPLFPHHEFGWGQEQVLPEQPCDAFKQYNKRDESKEK